MSEKCNFKEQMCCGIYCDTSDCPETQIKDCYITMQQLTTERDELQKRVEELVGIVEQLYDSDPCKLDHHGYCQTHSWLYSEECPHNKTKKLLQALGSEG